jgi:hypothetical protein
VLVLTGSGLKNIHVLPSQEARIFTSGLPDLDRVITTLTG